MEREMWKFETARYRVVATIEPDPFPDVSWMDADNLAALDRGELVFFQTTVSVFKAGIEIGSDHLGSSCYVAGTEETFFNAHRDRDPMKRNCSIMREANGANVSICHYFPDMVHSAIRQARDTLRELAA